MLPARLSVLSAPEPPCPLRKGSARRNSFYAFKVSVPLVSGNGCGRKDRSLAMQLPLIPVIFVVLAGACISLQAPLNAAMGRAVQSPLVAAAISFGVGFVLLTLLALMLGEGRGFADAVKQDWRLWLGGVLGAFYVWTIVWAMPRMGVLTATCALALGQMVAALALDRMGAFGLPIREISLPRILAALMVGGGIVISRF